MKKYRIFLLLFLITNMTYSQEKVKHDFSKEIDEQLWKSFVNSFNSRDGEKHIQIHTEDVLRITKNGIRIGKEYRDRIRESYDRKDQPRREIEFKFEHRIHKPNIAYEVGYFKIISFHKDGEKEYYGRFSVVLKKENGRWKIAQDWDVDAINGVPITAKDYEKLKSKIIAKK